MKISVPVNIPWSDLSGANKITALDLAEYHTRISDELKKLGSMSDHELNETAKKIQRQQHIKMTEHVQQRLKALMTPERTSQIASLFVSRLTKDTLVWNEILHYLHTVCFAGSKPERIKMDINFIKFIQRDVSSARHFDPHIEQSANRSLAWTQLPPIATRSDLENQIEDALWQAVQQSPHPAPLPSRVPTEPKLLKLYVEGVKFIYNAVQRFLIDPQNVPDSTQTVYNHMFMSAGEASFGVLHQLNLIGAPEGNAPSLSPLSRLCICPDCHVIFLQPIDAVEHEVAKRSEYAPSLGHVLKAVDAMSGQYGAGFRFNQFPTVVNEDAMGFAHAAQDAGLALVETGLLQRHGVNRAIWLPYCDSTILELFSIDKGIWFKDDKFDELGKIIYLIQAWFPSELANTPRTVTRQGFNKAVLQPLKERLGQSMKLMHFSPSQSKTMAQLVGEALGFEILA